MPKGNSPEDKELFPEKIPVDDILWYQRHWRLMGYRSRPQFVPQEGRHILRIYRVKGTEHYYSRNTNDPSWEKAY